MTPEHESFRIAYETIGIQPTNADRFTAHAIEWLLQYCTLSFDLVEGGFSVMGETGGEIRFYSFDEKMSWTLAGAVHACKAWMDTAQSVQDHAVEGDDAIRG